MSSSQDDNARDLSGMGPNGASGFEYSIPSTPAASSPYFNPQHGFSPAYINKIPLNTTPDYLDGLRKEKTRSFSEIVCYGAGMSYVLGQIVGGAWGAIEGNKHREATTTRLRINTILNGITKRGPLMGNSLAVVAMMYCSINAGIVKVRPDGGDDAANQIGAGVLAGALFSVTAGAARIVKGGVAGLVVASAMVGASHVWKSGIKF